MEIRYSQFQAFHGDYRSDGLEALLKPASGRRKFKASASVRTQQGQGEIEFQFELAFMNEDDRKTKRSRQHP